MSEHGLLKETMDFEKLLLFARDVEVRRRWKELTSYLECVIHTLGGLREISDADLRRALPVIDEEGDYEFECKVLIFLEMLARIKLRKRTLQVVPQRTMTGSYRRPRQDTFLGIGPPRIPKPTLPAPIAIRWHVIVVDQGVELRIRTICRNTGYKCVCRQKHNSGFDGSIKSQLKTLCIPLRTSLTIRNIFVKFIVNRTP